MLHFILECWQTEDSHVKTNIVHTLFRVQKYGLMSLDMFKDIFSPADLKGYKKWRAKTWYWLSFNVLTNFTFQVIYWNKPLFVNRNYYVIVNLFFLCFFHYHFTFWVSLSSSFLCSMYWVLLRTRVYVTLSSKHNEKSPLQTRLLQWKPQLRRELWHFALRCKNWLL